MILFRKISSILLLLALVLVSGSSGYMTIEDWSFLDSLYMTVITVASVGYGETHPLSDNGRIFTMILILFGSGILLYSISMITAFIVEGELTDILKNMKMKNTIEKFQGHFIVCGESQTGRYVVEELIKTHKPFVVIETDKAKLAALGERGIPYIEGDATTDAVLEAAGIERASGLITTLHTDAENLFVVLTAKGLNPGLRVIAKAVDEESRQKLQKVGADGVVMPNAIGGLRMVSEMVRPNVVSFLDLMLRSKDQTIRVEELSITPDSPFVGKTLLETGIVALPDVTVVALKQDGGYLINPPRNTVLRGGMVIIVMGEVAAIELVRAQTINVL
jgi:voltage-gated potassium channel